MKQLFSLTVLSLARFFFSSKKINMKSILPNVFDFVRYSFFVPSNSPRQPKLKSSFPSPPLSPLFLYFRSSRHSKEEKVPIVFLWPHFFELSILRTNFAFFFGGSRFAKNNGQRTQACANGTFWHLGRWSLQRGLIFVDKCAHRKRH